ncbi:PQQ-binding-like beta-propeller repeat protein [Aquicella lusitana]|uniref:Putative pyrroloquinoline-quinone-binding quinoprotein n=1 Tax=Aquicella lusitana TaxID=254246 RepID=A0A370GTI2_9COXI|nr:PQQ-binding-like beta-propeller repeat protein [Aquicella lusitana]RDI46997.1 putative pyrroloquinoline-quinone-binding quinoprotein [Aquicella lusitana]VVC73886.1 Desiccation/radiation resistance protein [Aquicella lusitana]
MTAFWRQFHGDGPSRGFAPVSSRPAIDPQWRTEVGRVGYASPVIGPDNTIYIGTLDDELVAVNPNGSIRWRREIRPGHGRSIISGSPAIDNDGNIYLIATQATQSVDHRGEDGRRQLKLHSTLYSFDPNGNRRWLYHFPTTSSSGYEPGGFSFSSPKVFSDQETYIFISVRFGTVDFLLEMMVLDQAGEVVHRQEIVKYPPSPITAGSNIGDILGDIWDFISSPIDFDVSGVNSGVTPLEELFGWAEPTIAIADFSSYENRPIIVIDDGHKTLAAYRWQDRCLIKLWAKVASKHRAAASPAVFTNSTIAQGQKDGTVALYNLINGQELAKPWFKAGKSVYSPPVSFGRQLYLVAKQEVIMLDSDLKLLQTFRTIGTSLGAPAISAKYLYVSARDGLWTFNFDLERVAKNEEFSGGVSSPAISRDGTVYSMDLNRTLWAF